MSKNYSYTSGSLSTGDGYWSAWDENPNDQWLTGRSYFRKNNKTPDLRDYGFTSTATPTIQSMFNAGPSCINNFYPLNKGSFTVKLNNNALTKMKSWLEGSSKLIYFTSSEFTGNLPSPTGVSVTNMLVASRSSTTYKTYLRFEATKNGNASFAAQCAANPVLRYGTDELPVRKFCAMIWFNSRAKPSAWGVLYDAYLSTMCCQSKVINSCIYRNYEQMKTFVYAAGLPFNYGYDMVCDINETLTNTWRIVSIDFSTGNAIVSNAISISPCKQVIYDDYNQGNFYFIEAILNETYGYPQLINYKTDGYSVTSFDVSYDIPNSFIPSVDVSRLDFADNAIYGTGRSFYNPGGVDSIPLSDAPGTYKMHFRRVANKVYVSYKGFNITIPYSSSIQVRVLSHISGNTYRGYTIHNLTEGFEHDISITDTQSPTEIYNVSEFHSALLTSIQQKTIAQWMFDIGTVLVSGTFQTFYHNGSYNIVASNITVDYHDVTASAINFSFDVVVQNETTRTVLVKTGFATDTLSASSSDSIVLPDTLINGINLTMPISAAEYADGNFVGSQALSVNQNSFGVSLEYDNVDDNVIDTETNPYFDKYFSNKW